VRSWKKGLLTCTTAQFSQNERGNFEKQYEFWIAEIVTMPLAKTPF
jgi:hypothetical protein